MAKIWRWTEKKENKIDDKIQVLISRSKSETAHIEYIAEFETIPQRTRRISSWKFSHPPLNFKCYFWTLTRAFYRKKNTCEKKNINNNNNQITWTEMSQMRWGNNFTHSRILYTSPIHDRNYCSAHSLIFQIIATEMVTFPPLTKRQSHARKANYSFFKMWILSIYIFIFPAQRVERKHLLYAQRTR